MNGSCGPLASHVVDIVTIDAAGAVEEEFTVDQFAIFASERAGFFVGWGTLSLINAGLAQGKNRSGLVWFLLSLILGPIATLVLVLMPKVRTKLF